MSTLPPNKLPLDWSMIMIITTSTTRGLEYFVMASHSKSRFSCDESQSSQLIVVPSRPSMGKGVTVVDELECMPDNPCFANFLLEDKEYFSGSIAETKT